ncbi:MAG: ABC transporter substrate-binding protein [Paludibacteraceae bacterium]|nr:ABC transporter substrate-binding protein [Paludibacteraceae bacterium]
MKMSLIHISILCATLWCMCACGTSSNIDDYHVAVYTPTYATGFRIMGAEGKQSTIISVTNPWQSANDVETMLFIARGGEKAPAGFRGQVLQGDAQRVVCMSSSHIAMLDAIGAVESVVGVSGKDFITNPYIVANRHSIADVGYDGNINFELLVAQRPDIVLLYGVTGACSMQSKLDELGIPYIYIGEYVEEDPLGKTEWLVALAEIVGCREQGIAYFTEVPQRYNHLKLIAAAASSPMPMVMLNTPYADSWFMPSTTSYLARLIADAGGDYIYKQNTSNHSQPIDLEEAALLTAEADIWLHVEGVSSLKDLRLQYPKFANMPCVQRGEIYNCDKRRVLGGGNDYWESGVVQPDVILRDLIKIFHPELESDKEFVYYRKLPNL